MIRIITDSTSSIPQSMRDELGIELISLRVNHEGREYVEGTMDLDAFYSEIYKMIDNIPTSSQPPLSEIVSMLADAAQKGDEVLLMLLSAKMSGTFESTVQAADQVKKRFPDFKYVIIDGMTNCLELGWPVIECAQARNNGASLDECVEIAKRGLGSTRFVFTPESLRFLEKGGRIGKAAALIGHLISISPILTVQDGVAATYTKVRTQTKALVKLADIFKQDIETYGLKNVAVHYIGSRIPAEKWCNEVIAPLVGRDVLVMPASPVIGVHVGPALGLVYQCAEPIQGKFTRIHPEIVYS